MIAEESNREFAAQCRGCPRREITRKPEANNTEQYWSQLRRKGWARTNYTFRDLGDTYWLWCPDCWQKVRRLPNYDNDTHRVLTKGQPMSTNETTDRPVEAAALAAVPDEAADIARKLLGQVVSAHLSDADGEGEDHIGPHPISIEGDARAIVAAVTPVLAKEAILDAVARLRRLACDSNTPFDLIEGLEYAADRLYEIADEHTPEAS